MKTVLIVEDEAITYLDLKMRFGGLGYDVLPQAMDYHEAMTLATLYHPDLVLMDISLDGEQTGIEAARRIREHLDIPVVFLTGHTDKETHMKAMQIDAMEYLVKPVSEPRLRETLSRLVSQAEELRGEKFLSGSRELLKIMKRLHENTDETLYHSYRVKQLAIHMARMLSMQERQIRSIGTAALLHDIGKVNVPREILHKPGKLSPEEYETVKNHCIYGSAIVRQFDQEDDVAVLIRYHHERWDGSGYPDGLRGTEIPLGSRIIALADAFDVMTNGRAYSRGLSRQEALHEILVCSGTQFDPTLVPMFLRVAGYVDQTDILSISDKSTRARPIYEGRD